MSAPRALQMMSFLVSTNSRSKLKKKHGIFLPNNPRVLDMAGGGGGAGGGVGERGFGRIRRRG